MVNKGDRRHTSSEYLFSEAALWCSLSHCHLNQKEGPAASRSYGSLKMSGGMALWAAHILYLNTNVYTEQRRYKLQLSAENQVFPGSERKHVYWHLPSPHVKWSNLLF